MIQAWSQHPGFFVVESLIALAFLCIMSFVFLRNRTFRHKERIEFLQNPHPGTELFFSGKLLKYIPWQFWTSLGILILVVICYFVAMYMTADKTAPAAFMDLIKTVTGAVIGSLFGKSVKLDPARQVRSREQE